MASEVKQLEQNTRDQRIQFAYEKQKVYLEVDKDRKLTEHLMEQNKNVKMEKIVSSDCLTEYQNLNYRQAKQITDLKSKLQFVKHRLSEELYRFANQLELLKKERADLEAQYKDKIESKNRLAYPFRYSEPHPPQNQRG